MVTRKDLARYKVSVSVARGRISMKTLNVSVS